MNIGDLCYYIYQYEKYECKILDIKKEYGPSIKNHLMQTMDLVYTTYYKISFNNENIWVTKNYLINK